MAIYQYLLSTGSNGSTSYTWRGLLTSVVTTEMPTYFVIGNSDGTVTEIDGSGLTYDSSGNVTGGTVTGAFHHSTSSAASASIEKITGISGLSAATFWSDLKSGTTGSAFDYLFSGNDTLVVSNFANQDFYDGGAGTNQLDLSGYTGSAGMNLVFGVSNGGKSYEGEYYVVGSPVSLFNNVQSVKGTAGNDSFLFGDSPATGLTLDGQGGTNSITYVPSSGTMTYQDLDLQSDTLLSIQQLMFSGGANGQGQVAQIDLLANQFGTGMLPGNLSIQGNASWRNILDIDMGAATSFSAAGLSFVDPEGTIYEVDIDGFQSRANLSISAASDNTDIGGGAGDDIIYANPDVVPKASDSFDGLGGFNRVVYDAPSSAFTMAYNSDGSWTLTNASANFTDRLADIETVAFTDKTVTLRQFTHADFDGNGYSDILFRNNANGIIYLFEVQNYIADNEMGVGQVAVIGAPTSTQVGANWQIKGIADFDGNGTADLLFAYNNPSNPSDPLNGFNYIVEQNGFASTAGSGVVQQLGPEWQVQGTGDFNGDEKADILYRNTNTGSLYLDIMNGTQITSASGFTSQQVANQNWQVAGIADFSGDSQSDILWRYDNPSNAADPLNGVLYEWIMNGTNVASQGLLSQQPGSDHWQVAGTGDFDGNGTADILFRYENAANASDPLNGVTYIDFMNGTQVLSSSAPTQWQIDNSWSIASVGDFNNDGKADILFQRASDGATYIWEMNGTATTQGYFTSQQSGAGWTVQNGVLDG